MNDYINIEFVRRRLRAAKRRYRYNNGPWAGGDLIRKGELLGLAHADVIQLTNLLKRLEADKTEGV